MKKWRKKKARESTSIGMKVLELENNRKYCQGDAHSEGGTDKWQ
ncbi:MAG: hypothetical protein ACETVW_03755 [Dehalococcoidia bacterium]